MLGEAPNLGESSRRPKSSVEVEAVAIISECLRALERAPAEPSDLQIVTLAQAINALELGDFDGARSIATAALVPPEPDPAIRERAQTLVRSLALTHLGRRFLSLMGSRRPDEALR
jgi:hypothetical protein